MNIEKKFFPTMQKAMKSAGLICLQFYDKVKGELKNGAEMERDVSAVDITNQEILLEAVSSIDSTLEVCAEEDTSLLQKMQNNEHEYFVIIDPLDGTANYLGNIKQKTLNIPNFVPEENYGIMATLSKSGKPLTSLVYIPYTGIMYSALRNKAFVIEEELEEPLVLIQDSKAIYYNTPVENERKIMSALEDLGPLYYPHCAATNILNLIMGKAQACVMKDANLHDVAAPAHLLTSAGGFVCNQNGEDLKLTKEYLKIPWVIFTSSKEQSLNILDIIN